MRFDHEIILTQIEPKSSVLDLGCGDGELLSLLKERKQCRCTGIEIDDEQTMKAIAQGVSVAQGDIDSDLDVYSDNQFDYVILNESLQQVLHIEKVLKESLRIGKKVIVGVPNFCHLRSRWQIFFKGQVPVTKSLPFKWYNTPNVRFLSIKDFQKFCLSKKISIEHSCFLNQGRKVSMAPNLLADSAIFVLRRI